MHPIVPQPDDNNEFVWLVRIPASVCIRLITAIVVVLLAVFGLS